MRVRFGELSPLEQQARARICDGARLAWSKLVEGDVAAARAQLSKLDARLEVVVTEQAGTRCVALVPLEASAWPLAELCLSLAPHDVACGLALGRPAQALPQALAEVRSSYGLSFERCAVRAGFGRGHLLDVTLALPGGTGAEIEQNAGENLVRALLGDRLFETWVGAVHVTPAPRGGPLRVLDVTAPRAALSIAELFDTVAAAARGVLEGLRDDSDAPARDQSSDALPSARHAEHADASGEWTLLEVEPVQGSHDTSHKQDLLLASTCTPELLRCYLDDAPCSSKRFATQGEHFVFVSYADERSSIEERVARRAAIEAALVQELAGFGRVTGVGLGVKTSYVDVALFNLETGLPRLVSKLRGLDLPARSFIEFFDSELADEWLSIWPDARLKGA